MKIAIGCDHGGYKYKEILKNSLIAQGHKVNDFGCYSEDACDYPDYAYPVAKSVVDGEYERGILLCGTGIGVSIAANKVDGARCALCSDVFSAEMTRLHNDSNILAMGGRVISEELMMNIVDIWLNTPFSNEARHVDRINKITMIEKGDYDER